MIAVSLIGPKKSGKTTLGVELAARLKSMGKRVAVVKFSSHSFDTGDTDTAKYAAVADTVAGLGKSETFVHFLAPRTLGDILPLLQADVLLIEGGKSFKGAPRILCLHGDLKDGTDWLSPELAIATWGEHTLNTVPAFTDVDRLARLVLERGFLLPGLDCGSCGRPDCGGLASGIVAGKSSPDDCQALNNSVEVTINGAPLGMKPFVEDMFGAAIRAMLTQLKGFAPGSAVIKLDV